MSLETLGEFTAWLRSPAENVIVLEQGTSARAASSVNRTLSAVFGFYEFHARSGVLLARELVARGRSGYGGYKPFLHGIAKARPRGRVGRLREGERLPRVLSIEQVQAILDVQHRLRDRFLFALLFETGMRVGQALGLRHEDVVSWERRIEIRPREDNANGARGKGGRGSVPVSAELMRLHLEYMHGEHGDLDSDYVSVNLWGGRRGAPMRYDRSPLLVAREGTSRWAIAAAAPRRLDLRRPNHTSAPDPSVASVGAARLTKALDAPIGMRAGRCPPRRPRGARWNRVTCSPGKTRSSSPSSIGRIAAAASLPADGILA